MSDETDIAPWLLEQIAADERLARGATGGPWRYDPSKQWHSPPVGIGSRQQGEEYVAAGDGEPPTCVAATGPADEPQSMRDAHHIAQWDPERVLAECEAKRRIIERWRAADESATNAPDYSGGLAHGLEEAIYLLAQPYADRPGWREEWALDDEGRPAMEDGG